MLRVINIFIIALSVCMASCVSVSVPKKPKKAKKKLAKHLMGIKAIVNTHPELTDTFTLVIHDTITLDSHSVDTSFMPVVDTSVIDAIMLEFMLEDASVRESRTPRETKQRVRYIRNKIIEEVLKDTTFFYEDSIIASTLILKDGKFYTSTTVKKKEIPYVKTTTTQIDMDCDTVRRDWLFWLLVVLLCLSITAHFRK